MSNKLLQSYVEKYINDNGYRVLSVYKNYHSKLKLKCPNNHIIYMSFSKFKIGQRCRYCNKYCNSISIDYIKEYVRSFKYKCLSDNYTLARDKNLLFECSKGHIYISSWNDFQQGGRCGICQHINNSGENHPMYGKHHSKEARLKISKNNKKRIK